MTTPFPEGAEPTRRTRRHLTILFADLSGYTRLSESVDPDLSLTLLQSLRRVCERVVDRHGGIVHGSKGDGVMAIFGFPDAIERAARAAVEAALELRDAMREVEIPGSPRHTASPRLHTGVHAGLVTFEAGDVSMIGGEAPNIAARLSDLAADDEILVSAATLGGERHLFDVKDRGTLRLHGREQPLAIVQVVGRSATATQPQIRTEAELTPFLGRTKELDRLDAALERVIAGHQGGMAIVGPAGVGKTRLVDRFLTRAADRSVGTYRGYCGNYPRAEPLQPLLRMLQQASRKHEPLVLFIDDWQYADDATRQALATIRLSSPNIFVVTASRDLPLGTLGDDAEVMYLPPFGEADARAAIFALWPDADSFQVHEVQRRSGGNPLYLEELCRWALPEPIEFERERSDALPAWLSTLIESRLALLPPTLTAIVQSAAVIGTVVPIELLEDLAGLEIDGAMLAELAVRDFLYRGEAEGTLRFKHGITRDVICASIPPRTLEQMQRHVAEFVEQRRR